MEKPDRKTAAEPGAGISRRELLTQATVAAGAALTVSLGGCGGKMPTVQPRALKQKAIILGFDAVDPGLLDEFMAAGELPNLARLAAEGGYTRLASSIPPESPVAWSTFSVSAQAGVHGIYDFLNRDPADYNPKISAVRPVNPRFLFDLIPLEKPSAVCLRSGVPFWAVASDNGIKSAVLQAPVSFPATSLAAGSVLLTGLTTPDLRGTQATYQFFTSDIYGESSGETEFGGKVTPLEFDPQGRAEARVIGPWNPVTRQRRVRLLDKRAKASSTGDSQAVESLERELKALDAEDNLSVPIAFQRNGKDRVTVELNGQKIELAEGVWSDWVEVAFELNFLLKVRGFCRLIATQIGDEVKVFMSPVEIHPKDPVLPISWPGDFSARLARAIGLYKTRGWAAETAALKERRIDEAAFLDDLNMIFDQRRAMALEVLDKDQPNLFFELFSCIDRVQHMFWRFRDPGHPMFDPVEAGRFGGAILSFYKRMDSFVGEVRARYEDPDTLLVVLSDHGFSSFRKGVNLNTWLVQNGFMRLKGQMQGQYNLKDLFGGGDFFQNVDWSATQAYSLGLGLIFVNLAGREAQGIVRPGEEYDHVVRAIAEGLAGLADPVDSAPVVSKVYAGREVYHGKRVDEAPDLVVGFQRNYRVSWQTALGGFGPEVVEPNREKWSGDHCSVDRDLVPGVLLCNRKIVRSAPDLRDIAPTVLKHLECPVPPEYEGQDLFQA
ncbi:alkaline phosphatase family protein [bacterium]|nr:alkaline phosphatase family protein [bacterium]